MPTVTVWTLAVLGWSLLANLVLGDTGYVPRNLALTAVLVLIGRRSSLSAAQLGLDGSEVGRGLRWGLLASAVVAAVVVSGAVLAGAVPMLGALLDDARADLEGGALVFAILVRIPLGTAVFEEVLFRGVLLATFLRELRSSTAVVASSVVFGLWHVAPTIVTLQLNDVAPTSGAGLGLIAGAVVVTTVAGLLFNWLRLRSRSLVAPMLVHWVTNASGLLAAAAT